MVATATAMNHVDPAICHHLCPSVKKPTLVLSRHIKASLGKIVLEAGDAVDSRHFGVGGKFSSASIVFLNNEAIKDDSGVHIGLLSSISRLRRLRVLVTTSKIICVTSAREKLQTGCNCVACQFLLREDLTLQRVNTQWGNAGALFVYMKHVASRGLSVPLPVEAPSASKFAKAFTDKVGVTVWVWVWAEHCVHVPVAQCVCVIGWVVSRWLTAMGSR